MNLMVPITLFGWIPAVLLLFAWLPARRAVIVSFLAAWLFLPMAGYRIPGFTEYSKMTATSMGVLLAVGIFDLKTLLAYRPHWLDLPMAVWCVCPFASSMSNGMGPYDGASLTITQTATWGVPYFMGRLYFSEPEGLRELAVGIFVGGLIYMPLCWYEIRMSPQLHNMVYGFIPGGFGMTVRYGGYRPVVFMQHGLMVGMWMVNTTLVGLWLWWTGALRSLMGMKMVWLVPLLGLTAILCKSTGAIALMLLGLGVVVLVARTGWKWPMIALIALAPAYMVVRTTGAWSGREVVPWVETNLNAQQASSYAVRLDQEDSATVLALQRPVFGWGVWGYEEAGGMDQLWLLTFRNQGLLGLVCMTLVMLLPAAVVCWKIPAKAWSMPEYAAPLVLALVVILYLLDCLFNGMVNPIFMLAAGGVTGLASWRGWQAARPAEAASPLLSAETTARDIAWARR